MLRLRRTRRAISDLDQFDDAALAATGPVSRLAPATTPAAGALTSAATSGGTLTLYGNNADGDILRTSWPKPVGADSNIEDLTEIAVPMERPCAGGESVQGES